MTASTLPILDPAEASNHLLDARASLMDIRNSTLPGDSLNVPVVNAIEDIDVAMKLLAVLVARRVEQRRQDVEQLGETS